MDRPSFEEAVRFAKAHLEQADADSPRIAAEDYRTSSADRRPRVLALLLKRSGSEPMTWDAVEQITKQLRRRGEPLPRELNDWVVDAFTGILPRPNQRGRPPMKARNGTIVDVIKKLQDVGFHPTRNNSTEPRSGCDVVVAAFSELGVERKYKGVESVWHGYTNWHAKGKIARAEYEWVGHDYPCPDKL